MTRPLELFCDEAGNTGAALLDPDQRYFAFSSVAVSNAEAAEMIEKARTRYPVQMPELKAAKLLRSPRGRQLIHHLLTALEGRYAVAVHDKVFSLCAHFFEYIYEPVFQASPELLYAKKMHVYVATVLYAWLSAREGDAEQAIAEFQRYLRSKDPADAPLLFERRELDDLRDEDPLDWILRFARACRHLIVSDNATLVQILPAEALWLGDLATTSLWAHLNHWGYRGPPIALTCDASKPLQAMFGEFSGDEHDPGIIRARSKGYPGPLGWTLARPIAFGDSKEHPALQLADLVAGTAAYAIRPDVLVTNELKALRASLHEHCLPQSILPDLSTIDPTQREALVNAAMLYRLTQKAELGLDLLTGLQQDYQFAEQGYDAGRLGGGRSTQR